MRRILMTLRPAKAPFLRLFGEIVVAQWVFCEVGLYTARQDPSIFVTPHILRQKGISAEIRAELAGHSLETTMKYGKPKRPEIERAITTLDDAATV